MGSVTNQMSIGIPFSLRQPAKTIAELKFNNDFCCIPYILRINSTFADALQQNHEGFKKLRNSLTPFSVLACFQVTMAMPWPLNSIVTDFVSRKHTMIVSNLHALTKRLVLNGHNQTGGFYFVPCPGHLSAGVSFCVCGDLMGLAVFADEAQIENP